MTVPHQSTSPGDSARLPEDRRHRTRRRWFTAIVIVLLIGVPAGYLLVSAEQSRDSGRDKEAESSATGLRASWPSLMKRRVFEIPIPDGSARVAYFETSNWKSSRLYVQFTTNASGLDDFLMNIGSSRSQLRQGEVTITSHEAEVVGWHFPPEQVWSGTSLSRPDPRPSLDVTVDLTDPATPRVYVVSTTTP